MVFSRQRSFNLAPLLFSVWRVVQRFINFDTLSQEPGKEFTE